MVIFKREVPVRYEVNVMVAGSWLGSLRPGAGPGEPGAVHDSGQDAQAGL